MDNYTTRNISSNLLEEISRALQNVGPYGSVEIYIQNHIVTQITMRNIKKTNIDNTNKLNNIHK
jgi:hypothetical protein